MTAGPRERVRAWSVAHPVATVAAAGLVVAAISTIWAATQRPDGTFNPDEAGYLATALRYERTLVDGLFGGGFPSLGPLWRAVGDTTTGPLVPLLSIPFVAALGRNGVAPLALQPWLHVLAAVGVAGTVARLATARRALLAGLLVLVLPGALVAGRSYVYASATAAALALATWALSASDRGRRRGPMLAFGAAVGALVLARTMAIAFVPAVAVAAVLSVEATARARRHLAAAAAVAVAVAAPWWLAAGSRIVTYLVDYGYTDKADPYGGGGIASRVGQRVGALFVDVRPLLLLPALVAVVAGIVAARRRPERTALPRPVLALWVVVAGCYLALVSTVNSGVIFELPVEVVLLAALVATVPAPEPRVRRVLVGAFAVVGVVNLAAVGTWRLGADATWEQGDRTASASMLLFGDMYQPITSIRTQDPLLLSEPGDRRRVGEAWWEAHGRLADAVEARRSDDGLVHETVTGSGPLMNVNTLLLEQERTQRPPTGFDSVDTSAADLGGWLTPAVGRAPRVLVVIDSAEEPFPADAGWARVEEEALAAGWRVTESVVLPDGGRARVLAPPG